LGDQLTSATIHNLLSLRKLLLVCPLLRYLFLGAPFGVLLSLGRLYCAIYFRFDLRSNSLCLLVKAAPV